MSAQDHAVDGHGHDHGHDHHEEDIGPHATLGGYLTGFVLSVFLTAVPFWLVLGKVIDKSSTTAIVILLIGAVQIVVHMIYFLHMNAKSEGGWNMLSLMFTLTLVVITLTGSLWVMFHLNSNMMPQMQHTQEAAQSGGTIVPPRTK
ncbi:MAG: cytochrome o ubiquinol oxidase subunit IV [Cupriavidus sp.]|jgi:cytochrome o ubiquinol oxidase operon protein cyoD|uniref:cytochrome o ubiquinol oxidase subunit IV n=1 Tax=Cupriavidus pauculus TaxID=82633 RepID=UPI0007828E36|nr:cytochrome o ubiquinol oxidase subunit IV [Cupriavidus pauculus]MBU65695.1 cytochrome o ubiquinol oxidase subunit IV [Cupriavidus sp.]KAB0603839.1 cytochrome o ubiquinol oxidase subunit IV [Cupriavidus pauculus]MBY4730131.1 cytochrome o ubiquinol oxidase subunit IV [Cupriavidus pauculus]MCM3607876.1 cytochrome o ubiquinol oxidase subunit IV [Cupriavidus pauculus]UAL03340.1 cytochrome o ubiquinol oxidase subunit IV [Cupriavidus pauculus]